jgi:hypothetical protein
MSNETKFQKTVARHPHSHSSFYARPFFTRRNFFNVLGTGLAGSAIAGRPALGQDVIHRQGVSTLSTARYLVMIQLAGAPSHVDTFDFKRTEDSPLELLKPETISGIEWPRGILPKLADHVGDMCIARSVRAWASAHSLAQVWMQIGRSPAAALGDIAPNMGTIVAIEKESERQPGQVFPTFLALNAGGAVGSGYISADFAPFKISPEAGGLPDTINPDSRDPANTTRFDNKYSLLVELDKPLRTANPYGRAMQDYKNFYENGRALMYNSLVEQGFRFTAEESSRYGTSGFGNACLVASKVLAARGGTRYVQIVTGGWDHHQNIYTPAVLPARARELDNGVSQLIKDLKASGVWEETLLVVMGEFGRTPGKITATAGRDHFLQQAVLFAGAGIKGGRTIGKTDELGSKTIETGWSRDRDIRVEDIEATIYSALGIDWTTVRYDDPFRRGFYYVPESNQDIYGPINELWNAS